MRSLNVSMVACTSARGLPLTAALMSEDEDCEIEQPWPVSLMSCKTPSCTSR